MATSLFSAIDSKRAAMLTVAPYTSGGGPSSCSTSPRCIPILRLNFPCFLDSVCHARAQSTALEALLNSISHPSPNDLIMLPSYLASVGLMMSF